MTTYAQRVQPPVFAVEKISIPEVRSVMLKNGIPVFLIDAGTEEILRMEFIFNAGQVKEEKPLVSSTCNMMLSEGSEKYTSEELNRLLDFYGVFLNQSAERDNAGIVLFLLNKHFEKVLEFSKEILLNPVFPSKELDALMKKRYQWFVVNREKTQNISIDKFFESVFGKSHPYGHQPEDKDFESITPGILSDFHRKYYSPANMAIMISGRINEDILDMLDTFYGDLPIIKENIHSPSAVPVSENLKKVHIRKEGAVQTSIRIGSMTINKKHPDYTGLKVLDTMLGGYFGSRLMKNIREDKGYTYGISSSLTSLSLSGYKVISTDVGQKYLQKTINEIYAEIRKLQEIPASLDEMNVVKNYMSGELLRMFDGPFALAETFKSVWELGLDFGYYNLLTEKIRTIQPDEIRWLAQTYYKTDDLFEITAGSE